MGDRLGEANVLQAIGDVQQFRKEIDAALESYGQALALFRQVGDRLGEANVYMAMGDMSLGQENWVQAILEYERALPLYTLTGARLGQANTLVDLGRAYFQQGRMDDGIACERKAAAIYRSIRLAYWEQEALRRLADMLAQSGQVEAAEQIRRQIEESPDSASAV